MPRCYLDRVGRRVALTVLGFLTISTMLCMAVLQVANRQRDLAAAQAAHFRSVLVADQLRQSSDDLSRMTRTYVVTGDPAYENYFHQILAIRDGHQPRPAGYSGIYWDFVTAGELPSETLARPASLESLMTELGLTAQEKAQLSLAKKNSEDLANLERRAMAAMKGLYADENGDYTVQGEPDPDLARMLVHGPEYHTAKASIMRPISDFFSKVEARTASRVEEAGGAQASATLLSLMIGVLLIGYSCGAFFYLRRTVSGPVSELVMTERALREGEVLLRAIVENIPDMIFVKDAQALRFVRFNKAGERLLGYPREELLGKCDHDLFPKEEADFFTAADRKLLERGGILDIPEQPIQTRLQGERILHTKKVPILNEVGDVQYLLGISEDITERKEAEEDRLYLKAQLQQAQKLESLGVLASGIAHDFNNLLVGVYGNMDLALLDLDEDSTVRGYIEEAKTAARRAADLISQMLAYAGKGTTCPEDVDLGELVREMASLLKTSLGKKTMLRFEVSEGLRPTRGDPTQIRQVVMNLITNAAQAFGEEPGEITLKIEQVECDRAVLDEIRPDVDLPVGAYLRLLISDTGPGMTEDTQDRIFEPFFTTKIAGSGLGLSAVHGIIRSHGGAIKVESKLGEGTSISVLLPTVIQPAGASKPDLPPKDWSGSGTILVVDDENSVRRVAVKAINRLGFSVLEASDGAEAVEVFRQHHREINCVLLDLNMPKMDGKETFTELRKIRDDLPVIICSGYAEEDSAEALVNQGLADYIQKPYGISALKEKLRHVLGG